MPIAITLNDIVDRRGSLDSNSFERISGNDIACRRRGAADYVAAGAIMYPDAGLIEIGNC